MLRFSTQFTNMHLLLLMTMMMMWALVVMTEAQPPCDPVTQYKNKEGQCCQMCGPGTSMSAASKSCETPQCIVCDEKEYQESYTNETKCKRQPYCDPNTNFQVPVYMDKIKRVECMCNPGFHCSNIVKECLTCVRHTFCEPGQWAISKGNQRSDTVCQKCPEGTFSSVRSLDSVCKKWKVCESGHHVQQNGTAVSDNVCAENSRQHLVVIVVVVSLIVIVVAVGVMVLSCRDSARIRAKGCVESCVGGEREPPREGAPIVNPTNDYINDELKEPIQQISQDDSRSSLMPEENEDEESQESFKAVRLSEKGNYVVQENGKLYPLPRQESQTHTHL